MHLVCVHVCVVASGLYRLIPIIFIAPTRMTQEQEQRSSPLVWATKQKRCSETDRRRAQAVSMTACPSSRPLTLLFQQAKTPICLPDTTASWTNTSLRLGMSKTNTLTVWCQPVAKSESNQWTLDKQVQRGTNTITGMQAVDTRPRHAGRKWTFTLQWSFHKGWESTIEFSAC